MVMECVIIGSGGCVSLPRPTCRCPICQEARQKKAPYARFGCSLFCSDAKLLIDTPEDIVHALNMADVDGVEVIAYSHWDPDHTLGIRVLEQLRISWLDISVGMFHPEPVRVLASDAVMRDVRAIANTFGSFLAYYERMGLARPEVVARDVRIGEVLVTLVPVDKDGHVTVFVLEAHGRRLVYAPCDCKPFPSDPLFQGADVLVMGNTMVGPALKDGFVPAQDNPLHRELYTLEGALALKERFDIPRLVITHLEEEWGKSYDDYCALEKQLTGVQFAYDGMRIVV